MFERYSEKERRVIFFARYEAHNYDSNVIDTEHLLLGLLREDKTLHRWLPKTNPDTIRQKIEGHAQRSIPIPTSVDLPLSTAAKRCALSVMRNSGSVRISFRPRIPTSPSLSDPYGRAAGYTSLRR
jgi:ATP-dependent Clp protease ATP-binding subunit ClpA